MTDYPRLIEFAFPLKQASLDSVHEKNVRHGHISTLHIWPARRPLAACRAALIATLLPDPGTPEARQALCEKIAGKVVKRIERKKMPGGQVVEREKEETVGGILHWGRETENAETLEWFRQEIRKAYGGRAPRVLDPFAGGGAIPLEAMRLGCEVTAIDINPVAWFILKCTLEYPQKLAGKTLPLPAFILDNEEFMTAFYKAHPHLVGEGKKTRKQKAEEKGALFAAPDTQRAPQADLAWHVRAWGQWVLDKARRELARFYPVYADFEPLVRNNLPSPSGRGVGGEGRPPMRLVPLKEDGTPDIDALNREFSAEYLANKKNPRWIAKPTVAYLWARTVTCKNCRATVPLLKTRWLCKKDKKRVLLTMEPNAEKSGVVFGIETNVPVVGGNTAQRREHDKRIAGGTMTRAGVKCPCCTLLSMTMEDIRVEGRAGRLGAQMTAVMVEGPECREYREPTGMELEILREASDAVGSVFAHIPHGRLFEPLTPASTRSISCDLYGLDNFSKVFTDRQQLALGTLVRTTRRMRQALENVPTEWSDALCRLLALNIDRVADRSSTFCRPDPTPTQSGVINTFSRFALPMTWDFIEGVPISQSSGGYLHSLEWVARVIEHIETTIPSTATCAVIHGTALKALPGKQFDVVLTDPPYYEAISYADLSDFFYVWQKRLNDDLPAFSSELTDKSQEAVQHVRSDKERNLEKQKYEDRMGDSFKAAFDSLTEDGRFVIVFAHKQPNAWETLVTSMIRAGFVVNSSWPIQTEMSNRGRALSSASLASSVWLVCKKRPIAARAGWDNKVLEEMRANIRQRLRDFWDAGIRGPDFVWAATGPALEAYSKHPVVKKADRPGEIMTVSEFLAHVRRMVVDFVVGRVLGGDGEAVVEAAVDRLDEATAYYLLHRNDFGMEDAPVGACILYATACSLSDQELIRDWNLLVKTGGDENAEEGEDETEGDEEPAEESGSGSKVKLKPWNQRRGRSMGYEAPGGRPVPLIDRIHRLMHLWKGGDVHKVDEYLDDHGLRRHELFRRVLQSLIELAKRGSEERSLLESLSNHIGAKGAKKKEQPTLAFGDDE